MGHHSQALREPIKSQLSLIEEAVNIAAKSCAALQAGCAHNPQAFQDCGAIEIYGDSSADLNDALVRDWTPFYLRAMGRWNDLARKISSACSQDEISEAVEIVMRRLSNIETDITACVLFELERIKNTVVAVSATGECAKMNASDRASLLLARTRCSINNLQEVGGFLPSEETGSSALISAVQIVRLYLQSLRTEG